tara:strand:- start:573 stop:881 length:309 start_codon:yes stop_codon:yes gene_type:complete
MKNLKIIFISILLFSFITGCGDFKKIMTNEKLESTDEFLVKKKDPLILPPKYYELPVPNSKKDVNKSSTVETLINSSKTSPDTIKNTSNLENMILNELRKKN